MRFISNYRKHSKHLKVLNISEDYGHATQYTLHMEHNHKCGIIQFKNFPKEYFIMILDFCSSITFECFFLIQMWMKCVTVAGSPMTMIPFSSLAVKPHQHRSLYGVKGNMLIPYTLGYTLTVNKKEIKRTHRLGQITCYCICHTKQINCWQKN